MKYTKKPVEIEAVQWTGDNYNEIFDFIFPNTTFYKRNDKICIDTLEGTMSASVGDYIIKGVKGEYYPCKPEIFSETYVVHRSYKNVFEEMYDCKVEFIDGDDGSVVIGGKTLYNDCVTTHFNCEEHESCPWSCEECWNRKANGSFKRVGLNLSL